MTDSCIVYSPLLTGTIKVCWYYFLANILFMACAYLVGMVFVLLHITPSFLNLLIPVFPFLLALFQLSYLVLLVILFVLAFKDRLDKKYRLYCRIVLFCLIPELLGWSFYFIFSDFSLPL